MAILLTNDDGFDAPGLAALRELMKDEPFVVAAPDRQYSACGHKATSHGSIPCTEESPGRFIISGTPVDCVRLGVRVLAPDVDFVLSGINPGGNLGVDLYMSGTVAAVREAALLGVPGIALSHYCRGRVPDWSLAMSRLRPVIAELRSRPHEPGTFWNVNLPHPDDDSPELEWIECEPDNLGLDIAYEPTANGYRYSGDYHARPRTPGRDADICFNGKIAVSRIRVTGH